MISYPIAAAKESGLFDDIFVSTDDAEIALLAHSFGARTFGRSPGMSEDDVGTQEVMADALRGLLTQAMKIEPWAFKYTDIDYACCIYPCAPMMTAQDLRVSFAQLKEQLAVAIVEFVYVEGWYYWGTANSFLHGIPLGAPLVRNGWIDINTPEDLAKAEAMYAALHPEVA